MSRVLVTGAAGFIGRHALAPLLARGYEVHALSRRPDALSAPEEVIWHTCDLLDTAAVGGLVGAVAPTALLHLAWDVEPGRFWTSVENVRWVEASLALMRAFADVGGERAVLAGTCAEYDWTRGADGKGRGLGVGERLHEQRTPIAPATLYGVCKHATQLVCAKLATESQMKFAWGRIFYLYGPHEQAGRLVPSIATSLLAGEPTPTSDGRQRRDFMHVVDVAAAFVALLDSDVEGPVNIASGEGVEVGSLVREIAAHAGREELLRWGEVARAPSDPDAVVADVQRLSNEVGFAPSISLQEGLSATVQWWRRRLAGDCD